MCYNQFKIYGKVPFNQGGLDFKREMLKTLSPEEFDEQLNLIQNSTRNWCIHNFIFDDEQIEFLNIRPELLINEIGLNSRLAIQFDELLFLETHEEYEPPMTSEIKRKVKTKVKGGGHYDFGTGSFNYKAECTITLTF